AVSARVALSAPGEGLSARDGNETRLDSTLDNRLGVNQQRSCGADREPDSFTNAVRAAADLLIVLPTEVEHEVAVVGLAAALRFDRGVCRSPKPPSAAIRDHDHVESLTGQCTA